MEVGFLSQRWNKYKTKKLLLRKRVVLTSTLSMAEKF
jgi:hypothetical protein